MGAKKQFCPRGHDTFEVGRYGRGRCVVCVKEDARAREQRGERTPLSPASKKKARLRERAWRDERPVLIRTYNRRYRMKPETKEKEAQYRRHWYEQNRVHSNQLNASRRRNIPALPKALTETLLNYYGSICVYCGEEASGFDHLHPVSRGGINDLHNLVPSCKSCNSKKWVHPIWVMLEEGGDLLPCQPQLLALPMN